jgi:hypothetical protein
MLNWIEQRYKDAMSQNTAFGIATQGGKAVLGEGEVSVMNLWESEQRKNS